MNRVRRSAEARRGATPLDTAWLRPLRLLPRYGAGLRGLRAHAPELAFPRLILRLLLWKACRTVGARPVIRLHGRSRMRIEAQPGEHGIRAGIFLFRDAYEPSVRCAIDRFVHEGAICYDIGANLGLWSLRMAERAGGSGRVYAFEPVRQSCRSLEDSAMRSGLANIEVLPVALGDTAAPAILYVPEDIGRGALAPDSPADRTVQVDVRRLDDCWEEQGRPMVTLVKIDVEGAEPLVLRGATRFFECVRPITCCEVNPGKLRTMGFDVGDVLHAFTALQYKAYVWSERQHDLVAHDATRGRDDVQDLVFVPQR